MAGYTNAWIASEEEVEDAINNCNVKLARKILSRNQDVFLWMLKFCGRDGYPHDQTCLYKTRKTMYDIGLHGVERIVEDPYDLEGNWKLNKDYTEWYPQSSTDTYSHDMPPVGIAAASGASVGL